MTKSIRVWDPSVILFHWLLAGLVGFLWWSGASGALIDYHPLAGFLVLGLLLYRLAWGLIGSHPARFSSFLRRPAAVLAYLRDWLQGRPTAHAGHNPAGGWMVVVMLAVLWFQGLTGLGTSDDIMIDGPLVAWLDSDWVDRLSGWHRSNANLLIALIGLHLLAVLLHDLWRREGLTLAMLHGRKAGTLPAVAAVRLRWSRLLPVLALAAGLVTLLWRLPR